MINFFLISVDRDKKGLSDEVDGPEIDYVHTIIVYESGKEIGRITEAHELTLEKDLIEILA